MAYEEPADPLLGKGIRHSKTASIMGVMGISKAIIAEPIEEPEEPEDIIVYKNDGLNLTITENDVLKAIKKLEIPIEKYGESAEAHDVADTILETKGFIISTKGIIKIGITEYGAIRETIAFFMKGLKSKSPIKSTVSGRDRIIYQSTKLNLVIDELDILESFDKLNAMTPKPNWAKTESSVNIVNDVLISKGFGDNNISPMTMLGMDEYTNVTNKVIDYITDSLNDGSLEKRANNPPKPKDEIVVYGTDVYQKAQIWEEQSTKNKYVLYIIGGRDFETAGKIRQANHVLVRIGKNGKILKANATNTIGIGFSNLRMPRFKFLGMYADFDKDFRIL